MSDLYQKQKRAREPGTGGAMKQKPGKIQTDQCQSAGSVSRGQIGSSSSMDRKNKSLVNVDY